MLLASLPRKAHAETRTGNAGFLRGYDPLYTAAALTLIYGTTLARLTQGEPSKFAAIIVVLLAALCLKACSARGTPDPDVSAAG